MSKRKSAQCSGMVFTQRARAELVDVETWLALHRHSASRWVGAHLRFEVSCPVLTPLRRAEKCRDPGRYIRVDVLSSSPQLPTPNQRRPNQTPAEAAGLQIYLQCTDHRQGPRSSSGSANDSTHSRPKGGLAPQHWGEGPLPLLVYLGVRGGPLGSRLEGGLQRKAAGREHPRPPAQPDAAVNVHLVV